MDRVKLTETAILAGAVALIAAVRAASVVFSPHNLLFFDSLPVIGLIALSAGYALRTRAAIFAPALAMLLSDAALYSAGLSSPFASPFLVVLMLFTASGMALFAFIGRTVSAGGSFAWFAAGTVWSVLLYDLWTNLGFWLGPFYPHTLPGLFQCFLMAVPFTLGHLLGALVLMPAFYAIAHVLKAHVVRPEAMGSPSI